MDASALLPLPFLLATRFVRREIVVWPLITIAVAIAPWSMSLAACVLVIRQRKIHATGTLAPLSAAAVRHLVKVGLLTMPASTLEWGVWSVAGGFVVLLATVTSSIAVNRRLDRVPTWQD
jgi:hypothetical protein